MKKLIAIISVVSALGFAVALANSTSNDNPSDMSGSSGSSSGMSSDTSGNMSGTVGSDTSSDTHKSSDASKSDKSKKNDKWSSAKTCTDENGVTYYKGRAGFTSCVDKMRKSEQMGGTTPSDTVIEEKQTTTDTIIDHSSPSEPSSGSKPSGDSGTSTNPNS